MTKQPNDCYGCKHRADAQLMENGWPFSVCTLEKELIIIPEYSEKIDLPVPEWCGLKEKEE